MQTLLKLFGTVRRIPPVAWQLGLILFLNFLPAKLRAQTAYDSLEAKLTAIYQQDRLPGLSVVMVNKEGVLYQKTWGYARIDERQNYTSHTVQNIGSVSKTFIAVALLKAIELGYFTLETDINSILPFRVVNPNGPLQPIKVKHLVTHTSGIVDNEAIYLKTYLFDTTGVYSKPAYHLLKQKGYTGGITDTSLSAFMYAYLSQKGNLYHSANFAANPPGTFYHYSNIASALAAYLIEVKTGLSFAAFTQKYILSPLQMNHSGWYLRSIDLKLHATPYYTREQALPLYSEITYPDGSLRTCTEDMRKYLIEMIKGYSGKSTLLSPASFQLLFSPRFSVANYPAGLEASKRNKGVFWNIFKNGIISQDGDDPGVSTYLFFQAKTGIGGFFMTNQYIDRTQLVQVLEAFATTLAGQKPRRK